ncbi:MAG: hydroxymethylbilane synthase [Halobacteriota archaeon]|nr:hydroxymethylbilane synthase [Halobacteriota archaeon]
MKVIIGTRGSKLAMKQTNMVADELRERDMDVELKIVKTSGDIFIDKSLQEFAGKGAFVSEINDMIVRGEVDLAVHSLKDLPTELPDEVFIAALLPRASRKDVLISDYGLKDLPEGARVGTSSTRRKAQLLRIRPDLQIDDIRGNIDTRIRKLTQYDAYDAIVMAKAGLDRLDINIEIKELPFITSAGQGAIAVVARKDSEACGIIGELDHRDTRIEVEVERAILGGLGGGCVVPMGVAAELNGDNISVETEVLSLNGVRGAYVKRDIKLNDYKESSLDIVEELKRKGGASLVEEAVRFTDQSLKSD